MAIETIKISQFPNIGDLIPNELTTGVNSGGNVQYNNAFPLLSPGTTGDRPTPSASMYYRLRFNTSLQLYEYYSPMAVEWIQLNNTFSLPYVDVTTNSITISPDTAYAADASFQINFLLPTICPSGFDFEVVYKGSGGWIISQNSGQFIEFSGTNTSTGIGGSISTVGIGGTIRCKCIVDNLVWSVTSSTGLLNII